MNVPLPDALESLEQFASTCDFRKGCVVLDLDGTVLLEHEGKVIVSKSVEDGVRAIYRLGRPVIINTLRFPVSVLSTVGEAWIKLTDVPILTVLLNGSVAGHLVREENGLVFQELASFPLKPSEIERILTGVSQLLQDGVHDLLLFFYTRNWRQGESLWTPHPERIEALTKKFVSASRVFSSRLPELRAELSAGEVCMACLFIDRPEDTLMAYQHSRRNNFFTAPGVDKASGLAALARELGISLEHSLGAGDTQMDSFLSQVGLAAIVGRADLPFRGTRQTVRVGSPDDLGLLISRFAALAAQKS